MRTAFQKFKRVVIVIYLIAIHGALVYFVGERVLNRYTFIQPVETTTVPAPNGSKTIPTPLPVPESFADANTNEVMSGGLSESEPAAPGLMIPVVGVRPDQLIDNFSETRSEDRYHDAIDIPAPAGTPVIAAADGEIARFWDSARGGITIYQITSDRQFVLYYAHLQRRADGISVGMTVRKGATIGYVGDTGNAGAGNFHLHFSIARITDPKRFWEGTNINPYPLLKKGSYTKNQ
jgi:murein DD-endopeptidase MepM/ murein hydrolase activator NlpD